MQCDSCESYSVCGATSLAMESVPAAGTWADFWEPTPQDGLPHPALIQGKDTGPAPIRYAMHMAYI